jgi:hypothetical protein
MYSIERSLNPYLEQTMFLAKFLFFFVALKLLSQVAELIGIVNAIVNSFLLFLILRFSKKRTDN